MGTARSFGRLFIATGNQAQGAPLIDRCFTRETDGAQRSGEGWLIRPPFARHRPCVGLVVGIWSRPPAGPGLGPEEAS